MFLANIPRDVNAFWKNIENLRPYILNHFAKLKLSAKEVRHQSIKLLFFCYTLALNNPIDFSLVLKEFRAILDSVKNFYYEKGTNNVSDEEIFLKFIEMKSDIQLLYFIQRHIKLMASKLCGKTYAFE